MPVIPRYEPIANSIGHGISVTPDGKKLNQDQIKGVSTNGVDDTHLGDPAANSWTYRDETALTPRRKIRVFTIGAGFAGLTLAYKLQHQYPEMKDIVEHTIFEALDTVGGTWYLNT
ncbi:hypothetical protein F5884DRAFT_769326 [Xylogone sp. PMI_703]|nr:hypothetical protein F5884DRAFT_769326 [Xylogone sp. PMI_703]